MEGKGQIWTGKDWYGQGETGKEGHVKVLKGKDEEGRVWTG